MRFAIVSIFTLFFSSLALFGQLDDYEKDIPSYPELEKSACLDSIHTEYYRPSPKYFSSVNSTLSFRHTEYRGLGYDTGYSTIAFRWFPKGFACNTVWPFVDVRGHFFNDREWAANAGLGFRWAPDDSCFVYGFHAYFDYRTSNNSSYHFPQAGIGLEILGECWEIRINGYVPIDNKRILQRCFFTYPGDFFIKRNRYEEAKPGIDGEIGRNIYCTDCCRLYAGLGPYHYRGNCQNVTGGRFRIFLENRRNVSLGSIIYYDNDFGLIVQGFFGLHFSFGCAPKCCRRAEMISQPVFRNEIIFLDEFCKWQHNY